MPHAIRTHAVLTQASAELNTRGTHSRCREGVRPRIPGHGSLRLPPQPAPNALHLSHRRQPRRCPVGFRQVAARDRDSRRCSWICAHAASGYTRRHRQLDGFRRHCLRHVDRRDARRPSLVRRLLVVRAAVPEQKWPDGLVHRARWKLPLGRRRRDGRRRGHGLGSGNGSPSVGYPRASALSRRCQTFDRGHFHDGGGPGNLARHAAPGRRLAWSRRLQSIVLRTESVSLVR